MVLTFLWDEVWYVCESDLVSCFGEMRGIGMLSPNEYRKQAQAWQAALGIDPRGKPLLNQLEIRKEYTQFASIALQALMVEALADILERLDDLVITTK